MSYQAGDLRAAETQFCQETHLVGGWGEYTPQSPLTEGGGSWAIYVPAPRLSLVEGYFWGYFDSPAARIKPLGRILCLE